MSLAIKPTRDEKRNHWDAASLAAYVAERNNAASTRILGDQNAKKLLRIENTKRFNPHRWMKGN